MASASSSPVGCAVADPTSGRVRSPGFTWGTVEHLFSIYMGLGTGVVVTATFGAWVGVVLIVLLLLFSLWVSAHITSEVSDA